MIIRPVQHSDLPALFQIAQESGPGFTSLMPDKLALAARIETSVRSFRTETPGTTEQRYLFVLEEPGTGAIMGTTGIVAGAGLEKPLHHFRHSTLVQHSRALGLRHSTGTLTRSHHYRNCMELCSLFLRPAFRKANAGKLLSKVRFAFIAQHPERFPRQAIAQMRGFTLPDGRSPFWNWMQQHFVKLSFDEVSHLAGSGELSAIEALMPRHPLYTHLMDKAARSAIGLVHPQTRPALAMLEAEGFRHRGLVDLLDAGPTVECPTDHITSVRDSRVVSARIHNLTAGVPADGPETIPLLVTNDHREHFRATVINHQPKAVPCGEIQLTSEQAAALQVTTGTKLRILPLARSNKRIERPGQPELMEPHYAQSS